MKQSYSSLQLPEVATIDGFDRLNEDHRRIAKMIDDLRVSVIDRPQRRIAFPEFEAAVRPIEEAFRAHFEHEEDVMAALSYPGLAAHAVQHANGLAQLNALIADAKAAGHATVNTVDSVFATLVDDALKADLAFKTFLYEKGLATR
jgi:hemerythrin-like metal-binding protein